MYPGLNELARMCDPASVKARETLMLAFGDHGVSSRDLEVIVLRRAQLWSSMDVYILSHVLAQVLSGQIGRADILAAGASLASVQLVEGAIRSAERSGLSRSAPIHADMSRANAFKVLDAEIGGAWACCNGEGHRK